MLNRTKKENPQNKRNPLPLLLVLLSLAQPHLHKHNTAHHDATHHLVWFALHPTQVRGRASRAMLLWCGLDEAVVSTPMADEVLAGHPTLVRSLGQWKRIHSGLLAGQVRLEAEDGCDDDGEWSRVLQRAAREYPSLDVQSLRHEAASLCALPQSLPQGWSAVVAGADLTGSQRAGQTVDVALFTEAIIEPVRMQLLASILQYVRNLFGLSETEARMETAPDGTPQIVVECKRGDTADQPLACALVVGGDVPDAVLDESVKRMREMGIGCLRVTGQGMARQVVFDSASLAAIAINNGFCECWGGAMRFANTPLSLQTQRVCMSYAESLAGGAIPYRSALLLRHYLAASPMHLWVARVLLAWLRHHQLTQRVSDYALLVLLAHFLLASGRCTFLDPARVTPLGSLPPTLPPDVNPDSLAEAASLCQAFFGYYASFDWAAKAVSLNASAAVDKAGLVNIPLQRNSLLREASEHVHSDMWVSDPLTNHNLLKAVSGVRRLHITGLFAACFALLKRGRVGDVFGADIGRSHMTLSSDVGELFRSLCGADAAPSDIRDECFVDLSPGDPAHQHKQGAAAAAAVDGGATGAPSQEVPPRQRQSSSPPRERPPPSPSYTRATLQERPESASIRELMSKHGMWDDSPALDSASVPATPTSLAGSGLSPLPPSSVRPLGVDELIGMGRRVCFYRSTCSFCVFSRLCL